MRRYEEDFNEEYEKGYEDGRNSVFDDYLAESEEDLSTDDYWKLLQKKYKEFLNKRQNTYFFESPSGAGELSIELEINHDSDYYGEDVIFVDTFSLVGGQFNIDRIRLQDTLGYLKKMRGLSIEGKKCKNAFKQFLKDIQSGKFKGIKLAYSNIRI